MNKENKIARGKQIISDMKSVVYNYYAKHRKDKNTKKPKHFSYYCTILHALSYDTHEQPVAEDELYLALAEAEEQGKKVYIEPDPQFVPNDEGKIAEVRADGWIYHIVIA